MEIAIFRFCFAITVLHKRAVLLIFCTECTESLLDILPYPESTIGPPWLGLEKIFKNEYPQKAGKRYFVIDLCKHS